MMYKISLGHACDLCLECVDVCEGEVLTEDVLDAIKHLDYPPIYREECTFCECCMDVCPEKAIRVDLCD